MNNPQQLTWICHFNDVFKTRRSLTNGYTIRAIQDRDKTALAGLYLAAYPREIVRDITQALDEMERCFLGEYGKLDLAVSLIALHSNFIVASVMTVIQAPWDDTPPGPFIIEVMVHPSHRKLGLAEFLLSYSVRELNQRGSDTVALRVMSDNTSALNLYRKLGFVSWNPDDSVSD